MEFKELGGIDHVAVGEKEDEEQAQPVRGGVECIFREAPERNTEEKKRTD